MAFASKGSKSFTLVDPRTVLALDRFRGDVWFVNGDKGTTGSGRTPKSPFDTITKAVNAAADGDIILIEPRKIIGTATDPVNYAETITIPAAKRLALIGVGFGNPVQGGQPQIKKGSGSTAQLTVRSAGCLIANLTFNGGSATGGGILLDDDGGTSKNAFGTHIVNCYFKNCRGSSATEASTGGAIQWKTAGPWQVRISGCRFYKNVGDIVIGDGLASVPQDIVIEDCEFSQGSSTNVNLYVGSGGVLSLIVRNCMFPAIGSVGGADDQFFTIANGTTGLMANCHFGCTGLTWKNTGSAATGGNCPATFFFSGCYQENGLMART